MAEPVTIYTLAEQLVVFLLKPRLPSVPVPPPLPWFTPIFAPLALGIVATVVALLFYDNRIFPKWLKIAIGAFGALATFMGALYLLGVSYLMPMGLGGVLASPFIFYISWYLWDTDKLPKLVVLVLPLLGILALVGGLITWQEWTILEPSKHYYVVMVLTALVVVVIIFAAAMINTVMMIWVERKVLGRMHDRRGAMHVGFAGLLQNFADGMKLFTKEAVGPKDADKLGYVLAPAMYAVTSIVLIAGIPISDSIFVASSGLMVLFLLAVFSLAPFFIFLAGWSSNNKYTLIGGVRSAAQLIAYEIPLILSVVAVMIYAGTLELGGPNGIIAQQQAPLLGLDQARGLASNWFIIPMLIAFVVFSVAMLAEVERIPFDLPEAEAELVEGWTTEYSSMKFAFIMLSDYIRGYVAAALGVLLFFGGWVGPSPPGLEIVMYPFWFFLKVYLLFFLFIWIRASLPRVRTDQLLHFGWKKLLPQAFLAIGVSVALVMVSGLTFSGMPGQPLVAGGGLIILLAMLFLPSLRPRRIPATG